MEDSPASPMWQQSLATALACCAAAHLKSCSWLERMGMPWHYQISQIAKRYGSSLAHVLTLTAEVWAQSCPPGTAALSVSATSTLSSPTCDVLLPHVS